MKKYDFGLNLFLLLAFAAIWFGLWIVSYYLTNDVLAAVLFFPAGLLLALLILLPLRFCFTLLIAQWLFLLFFYYQQLHHQLMIMAFPLICLPPAMIARYYWQRYHLYWQRLSLLLGVVLLNSLLQGILAFGLPLDISQVMLATLTGSVLVIPFIYLLYEYFRQENSRRLMSQKVMEPPLKSSLLVWGALFFSIGVSIQLLYTPEMSSLLLLVIFIPNIFMAYRFGWQGGVFAALIGSILLTIARQASGAFQQQQELQIFLATQALLGICLGIAVSRQQQLVHSLTRYRKQLEKELKMRRNLTEQLVNTEESIRKEIARELHDEIGQNITAIQIQSMLVNRSANNQQCREAAGEITRLSNLIHQTTRQLLRKLRPLVLDEMSLRQALNLLIQEFHFQAQGITLHFNYQLPDELNDETLTFTLYRLIQELLNNINKHAKARHIELSLELYKHKISLKISDDGIGISPQPHNGMGLKGIDERVNALGGSWNITNRNGTQIIVNLPTKLQ